MTIFLSKPSVLKFQPKKLYYWCFMNFCFCLFPATSSRLLHPFLQEEQMTAGFALWVSALMADTLPVLQMTGNINVIYFILIFCLHSFYFFLKSVLVGIFFFTFFVWWMIQREKKHETLDEREQSFSHISMTSFSSSGCKWSICSTLEHKTRVSHDFEP